MMTMIWTLRVDIDSIQFSYSSKIRIVVQKLFINGSLLKAILGKLYKLSYKI